MNRFRKLTSALLVVAMVISILAAGIFSPTAHAGDSDSLHVHETHINPLYEDVLGTVSFNPPRLSAVTAAAPEYLSSAQEVALVIRQGMIDRLDTIALYINTPGTDGEVLKAFVQEAFDLALSHTGNPIEGDYLKWQYGGWQYSASGAYASDGSVNWEIPFVVTYYTTTAQERIVDERVDTLLDELNVYTASDYEKLCAIYDYICANVVYDHANLNNSSYTLKYTCYAALLDGTAVCQGYALLLYRLALELGVDARLIAGDGGGPHGWNIARLNDLYYNLDSTWDAGSTDYRYFLVCPTNFKDHTRYAEYDTAAFHAAYPMDDADYDPADEGCVHTYTSTITKEATCTDSGESTYTCTKCGNRYIKTISALGHEEVIDKGYDASCTEDGLTDGSHCERCGIILTKQESIPAPGHIWDEGKITREPTETQTGIRTFTCTVCGETRNEDIPVKEHTHSYTAAVTAPTCTEEGFTTYTCSCGDSYTADEVPAAGHTFEVCAGMDPTCTEDGMEEYACVVCWDPSVTYQVTLPALGHSWDDGTVTREPTETETGIRTFACEICGETKEETIPVLDHEHSYTALVTAPTCTEEGFTTYTCSCGDSYTADEIPALGHEEVIDKGYDASCTEDGLTDGSHCERCGIVLTKQETIPALGHSWDDGTVTRDPTETQTGIRTFTCTVCGETRNEDIPVIENTSVTRIYGDGRVETAIEAAEALKAALKAESFSTIILANGDNFADALAGSYLATVKDAPILLHRNSGAGDELNQEYILNNLTEGGTVYVLGGTIAIPEETIAGLVEAGIMVTRLQGEDRFMTNLAILEEAGVSNEEILIATGWEFADCLSASAAGKPILMVNTNKNVLSEAHVAFLTKHAANNFTIVGGPVAVSEELEAAIDEIVTGEIVRLAGSTREETSVLVAERFFEAPKFAVLAYSRNFPDGLCGGPLAYAMNAPLLLTNTGMEDVTAAYIAENEIKAGYIMGGPSIVSEASVEAIFG